MLYYYKKSIDEKYNIIYSLDMVRLKICCINIDNFLKFISKFDFEFGFSVDFYNNFKTLGYRYLWCFHIDEFTFSLGMGLNTQKELQNEGFLEFNPNKLMNSNKFLYFYDQLLNYIKFSTLVRYDLSIDIPIAREYCHFNRSLKCKYSRVDINNSITEYQGCRNKNKFCKLYDKTKESNLDYNLTRFEITLDRDEFNLENIPEVSIISPDLINNKDFSKLSSTQLVLIDLLRNSIDFNFYIHRLSRNIREKILPFLSDFSYKINYFNMSEIRDIALEFEYNLIYSLK